MDFLISPIRLGHVNMLEPIRCTGNETITDQSGFTTAAGACGPREVKAGTVLLGLTFALQNPVRQNWEQLISIQEKHL